MKKKKLKNRNAKKPRAVLRKSEWNAMVSALNSQTEAQQKSPHGTCCMEQNSRTLTEKEWEALKDIIGLARGLKAIHNEGLAKCIKATILISDLIDSSESTANGRITREDWNRLVQAVQNQNREVQQM